MLAALDESPDYVGFWDADLATPLDEIPHFCRVLDEHPDAGHRDRLAGCGCWATASSAARCGTGWAGCSPIWPASCWASASTTRSAAPSCFGPIATCAALFAEPFRARWIFDVELFARLVAASRQFGGQCLEHLVYEYPLDCWRDVAGSKLRPLDFVWSLGELARIYWTYLRPGFASPAVTARLAGAGHLPEIASEDSVIVHPKPAAARRRVAAPLKFLSSRAIRS